MDRSEPMSNREICFVLRYHHITKERNDPTYKGSSHWADTEEALRVLRATYQTQKVEEVGVSEIDRLMKELEKNIGRIVQRAEIRLEVLGVKINREAKIAVAKLLEKPIYEVELQGWKNSVLRGYGLEEQKRD